MSRNQTGAPPITRWLPLQSMINSGADIPRTNPLLLEEGEGVPSSGQIKCCLCLDVSNPAHKVFGSQPAPSSQVKLDVAMVTDDRSPITTAVLHSWVWHVNCENMSGWVAFVVSAYKYCQFSVVFVRGLLKQMQRRRARAGVTAIVAQMVSIRNAPKQSSLNI